MTTDEQYTPSEGDLIRAWKAYRDAVDAADAWVREDNAEPAEDEARRALARVRRDAAREALDGIATSCEQIAAEVYLSDAAFDRWSHVGHVIRETLAIEYPEETP